MERLTKQELRALLEYIKECYPNCDLRSFSQRVFSRLSKIVLSEIISHNGIHPHRGRKACAIRSHHAYISSGRKISNPRVQSSTYHSSPNDARHYTRPIPREGLSPLGRNNAASSTTQRKVEFNRDQLVARLPSPHIIRAHRNPKTVIHIQQKFTLINRALNTLNLGLIVLTPDGKVRLATTCAVQRIREYLGHRSLIGERLPESLWMWVKQQEARLNENGDAPLLRSRLILEREGKRLVIRLVSGLDRILLLREEHPTTMQAISSKSLHLSPREAEVLNWLSQGKTNKEIGVILELSARTVQKHLEHIYQKLGVETRTAAAARAYETASMASKQTGMFLFVIYSLLT